MSKNAKKLPKAFLDHLAGIKAKRAKNVIDHILKNGHVTTQELRDQYGYNHPPRGAQDVKDLGVPLKMVRVVGEDGRRIAAYEFGNPAEARFNSLKGRAALSKKLKSELVKLHGARCAITNEELPEKDLQIDHRIPYQIAGDTSGEPEAKDFMLLSRSANRSKSWACEHCANFVSLKNAAHCKACYWASPNTYGHVALKPERRLDALWEGEDVVDFDQFVARAHDEKMPPVLALKLLIRSYARRQD